MVSRRLPSRARQRGAALLIALLIMTLVATLAAGMVWMQWRGIQVEAAERARTQAQWLLNASLDWGNLILRSQARGQAAEDDLGQPWATPLAETKLSSFLSADGNHADDGGPEAYLSGQITDADSKYNVWNILVDDDGGRTGAMQRLAIICNAAGVPASVATTIGAGLRESLSAQQGEGQGAQTSILMPMQVEDLAWYGIDPKTIRQLKPFIQILPMPKGATDVTTVNANTAPPEVLLAAIPGLTQAQAQQLVLARQSHPFKALKDVQLALGSGGGDFPAPPKDGPQKAQVDVKSKHFEIYGQLRYEQHVIRERSVVYRENAFAPIQVLRRERIAPDPA